MALSRGFHFFFLLFILTACGKSKEIITLQQACVLPLQSELIIGNNDWIIYNQTGDEPQNANERTVARIKIPNLIASCNGFLINTDTIMTNNHCVGSMANATNVTATFRDTNGPSESFICDQIITTSTLYDFTLLKCKNSPGLKYGWVGLDNKKTVTLSPIYIVQENCDYVSNPYCTVEKYVSFGKILASQASRAYHDADTLPGSSGSPVFSAETHQVISLHNVGIPETATTPAVNASVPMFQIRDFILKTTSVPIFEYGTAGNSTGGISSPSGSTNGTNLDGTTFTPLENCSL